MSSRAASRIVIGLGLAVVFGIGVAIIMEQGAQIQPARNAPAVSSGQTAVKPSPTDAASAPKAEATPAPEHSPDSSAGGADTDGQITAQVRSSIASLAPGSNIDVKATSGTVALAGSVPTHDVVEQARRAAQQVPGVKQVDTSALLVQNR